MVAIEKAMEFHWKKLWIETDFMLVVKSFSNSNFVPWNIKSRWLNYWLFTLSIDFIITYIQRRQFCVDFLANLGLKTKNLTWFSNVHRDTIRYYLLDKDGTPRIRLYS